MIKSNQIEEMISTKNNQRYAKSLIEANVDPFLTIDANGIITDVNEAFIRVTGASRNSIVGSRFSTYFTEPKRAEVGFQHAFEKGGVTDSPLTIKHKTGELTDVLFNAFGYKDSEGKVVSVFATARDLKEQKWAIDLRTANQKLLLQKEEKEKIAFELAMANKKLLLQIKEKERKEYQLVVSNQSILYQIAEKQKKEIQLVLAKQNLLFQKKQREKQEVKNKELEAFRHSLEISSEYSRSLIEASRDPLVTINAKGKIMDVNEASVLVTGIPRESIINSDFSKYFTDPEKAEAGYQQVFKKGFVSDYSLTIKHKNGKLTDVLYNASIYKNKQGKVLGVFASARDVTDQKKNQSELVHLKEMAEITTVIAEEAKTKAERATKIAEGALKAKQQFLSNMSHEIRTPMNAIIGFTKVVLKTKLTPNQKEYLTAIKESGDAMIVLINDILDLAKVDAGKLVFEEIPFNMETSVISMLHLFEPRIQEKDLTFSIEYDHDIPEVLIGDPIRLHQIIINLVSNALKFTNKGEIKVSLKIKSQDEDKVTILFVVRDTGIGIAEDKIEQIFENFQQAYSTTSSTYGGTGLGLAIVKQLVESQGGKVSVESELGLGSAFCFSLTFSKTQIAAECVPEIIEMSPEYKDLKILVAEDIPLNQLLMKTILEDFEFTTEIAENGKKVIEKLEDNEYDIIIMDLQMPEMNGFEATKYIRNVMKSDIPIIALTADVTTVDLKKCLASGMNDYLAKPVDENVLYSKIIALVKDPLVNTLKQNTLKKKTKQIHITNMDYLQKLTKSNPKLIKVMITLYLEQAPTLIEVMKQSFKKKNWSMMHSAVHKMIPSFKIIGVEPKYEKMARKVIEYNGEVAQMESISKLLKNLDFASKQACKEMEEELNRLKNT